MLIKNLTANAVAVGSGLRPSTIARILAGEIDNPRTATVESIANFFGVHLEQLEDEKADFSLTQGKISFKERVPLIPASEVSFADIWGPSELKVGELNETDWLPAPPDKSVISFLRNNEASERAEIIAFINEGNAMEPIIQKGDTLYVALYREGFLEPKSGDIVLALHDSVVIRQIEVTESKEIFLRAINPNWPSGNSWIGIGSYELKGKVVGLYRSIATL